MIFLRSLTFQVIKSFFCLTVLSVIISSCSNLSQDKINRHIENESSVLLELIKCTENDDYPKNWETLVVDVYQGLNDDGDEYSSCKVFARDKMVDAPSDHVYFFYSVVKSQKSIKDEDLSMSDMPKGVEFNMDFTAIGNDMRYLCLRNSDEYGCNIIVQYKHAILTLYLTVPGQSSIDEIEAFINTRLMLLDARIRDVDALSQ